MVSFLENSLVAVQSFDLGSVSVIDNKFFFLIGLSCSNLKFPMIKIDSLGFLT